LGGQIADTVGELLFGLRGMPERLLEDLTFKSQAA
jgi:hypothetical protein